MVIPMNPKQQPPQELENRWNLLQRRIPGIRYPVPAKHVEIKNSFGISTLTVTGNLSALTKLVKGKKRKDDKFIWLDDMITVSAEGGEVRTHHQTLSETHSK